MFSHDQVQDVVRITQITGWPTRMISMLCWPTSTQRTPQRRGLILTRALKHRYRVQNRSQSLLKEESSQYLTYSYISLYFNLKHIETLSNILESYQSQNMLLIHVIRKNTAVNPFHATIILCTQIPLMGSCHINLSILLSMLWQIFLQCSYSKTKNSG